MVEATARDKDLDRDQIVQENVGPPVCRAVEIGGDRSGFSVDREDGIVYHVIAFLGNDQIVAPISDALFIGVGGKHINGSVALIARPIGDRDRV